MLLSFNDLVCVYSAYNTITVFMLLLICYLYVEAFNWPSGYMLLPYILSLLSVYYKFS